MVYGFWFGLTCCIISMTQDPIFPKLQKALNVAASLLLLAVRLSGLQVDGLAATWPVNVASALCDLFLRDYSVDFLGGQWQYIHKIVVTRQSSTASCRPSQSLLGG